MPWNSLAVAVTATYGVSVLIAPNLIDFEYSRLQTAMVLSGLLVLQLATR